MDLTATVVSVRTVLILCISVVFGYLLLTRIFRKSTKNLPPGPRDWGTHWRVLKASWNGTLPQLAAEFAQKYGPITYVPTFGKPLVLLNSAHVARQMLGSDKYKTVLRDRVKITAFHFAGISGKDLVFCDYSESFKKKRRLLFNLLKMYGDGVEKFENVVWSQLERMFTEIDQTEGNDVEFSSILGRSLIIIIYILTMGECPDDPTIPDVLEEYDIALNTLAKPDIDMVLQYIPFIANIPGKFKAAVDRVKNAKKKADKLVYYDRKATFKPGQPRGIADLLLDFGQKPGNEWMNNDEDYIAFLTSLFFAAHLTSRSALFGAFLCLLNNPDVVKKIQEEIDRVIGTQQPRVQHKSSMPYTEAALLETLRIVAAAPLNGFRLPSEDFEFQGMTIPKDCLILTNNGFFDHDENVWEDPWTFKPERFLDNEYKVFPLEHPIRKNLLSFGVGLRSCPGEMFARSRIFLFITSILQRYNLLPPVHEKLVSANLRMGEGDLPGLMRQWPPFKCRLIRRKT